MHNACMIHFDPFSWLRRFSNRRGLTYLANKSEDRSELTELVSGAVMTPLSNEALGSKAGSWIEIAPYGKHRHSAGMQVFDRNDATAMVQDFANSRRFKWLGLPWYIGHPDHPQHKDRYKDGAAYGRIKELRAGVTGLEARLKLGSKGMSIVNEEVYDGHSPNWGCIRDASGNYRPRTLLSVGWTNEANIDVKPIMPGFANEKNHSNNTTIMDIQHVKETLLASGLVKPGATEEEVKAAVTHLANEFPGLKTEAAKAADLQVKLTAAETKAGELTTNLANERLARAGMVVDVAITEGRLETGKKDDAIEMLANEADFEKASQAMLAVEPKFKTKSKTGDLGGRSTEAADKGQQITALANEGVAKGLSWDAAYNAVQVSHPELFTESK